MHFIQGACVRLSRLRLKCYEGNLWKNLHDWLWSHRMCYTRRLFMMIILIVKKSVINASFHVALHKRCSHGITTRPPRMAGDAWTRASYLRVRLSRLHIWLPFIIWAHIQYKFLFWNSGRVLSKFSSHIKSPSKHSPKSPEVEEYTSIRGWLTLHHSLRILLKAKLSNSQKGADILNQCDLLY